MPRIKEDPPKLEPVPERKDTGVEFVERLIAYEESLEEPHMYALKPLYEYRDKWKPKSEDNK